MKNESKGIVHLFKALTYSIDGLKWIFKKESAFRHDVLFALIVIVTVCFVTNFDLLRCSIVTLAFILLCIVELLNTAIECVVDMISPEYNILAKASKDMGSASVFLTIILVCITTILVIIL